MSQPIRWRAVDLIDFMRDVLTDKRLALPMTGDNGFALLALHQEESDDAHPENQAAWNPWNTTWRLPGSTTLPGSSVHVQEYVSRDQGVEATVLTLAQNTHGMPLIREALATGRSPFRVISAWQKSDWGTQGADAVLRSWGVTGSSCRKVFT